MVNYDLDILLPTGRKRLHNLLFQIRAILSSSVNARPTVLMGAPWPELEANLSAREKEQVRIISNAPDVPALKGQQKVLWALENLEMADWFGYFSDDDALLPWGLECLMANTSGVAVVFGRVLGVSRDEHLDFTPYTINKTITRNRCSNAGAIYKTDAVKNLEKPWIDLHEPCSDWLLMYRLAAHFGSKAIPNTISIVTLYEMAQFNPNMQRIIQDHNAMPAGVPC